MMPQSAFNPPVGIAEDMGRGIRRILAPNPSPMTYLGTNTYMLGETGIAVIDPGPDDQSHLAAILGALGPGQRVTHILVTHAHLDHSPLAAQLARETGAKVHAFGHARDGRSAVMERLAQSGLNDGGEGIDHGFCPDIRLADGEVVTGEGWTITALWTPGHLGNHLCFQTRGAVFTGDLVMGWASSLVSPPDGDLTDFMASCARLKQCPARVYYPGHGAPVCDPAARIDWLIAHRKSREAQILARLEQQAGTLGDLTTVIYHDDSQARVFRDRVPALNLLKPGSPWVEVDPRLEPAAGERVVEKQWASGFFKTDLDESLRAMGVDSLVVTGLTTSGCVRATAVDGLQYDYKVVVPAEAVGDRNPDAHRANLFDLNAKYVDVLDLVRVLAIIEAL